VIGHKRYTNLSRPQDMPYSPGNIESGKQASHEVHRGALGQCPEERCSHKQQMLEGKLAKLEWI